MPRLLILSHHFPPSAASASFRMLGFARHLPKFGWNVSVVASGPTPWEATDHDLAKQIPDGTTVQYVDFPLKRAQSAVPALLLRMRLIDPYYVWNRPALAACSKCIAQEKPDAVLSTGPPHSVHLAGRRLKQRFGLPWIADFRDPWCSWGGDESCPRRWSRITRYLESSVMRHADLVVANTPNVCQMLQEAYPRHRRKIISITNGFDPSPVSAPRYTPDSSHEIRLAHTGELYAGRDPRPLLDAIEKLSREDVLGNRPLRLILMGRNVDEGLPDDVRRRGLEKVVDLRGQVPHTIVQREMSRADVLVLIDTPGRRIGVPAKLYEYIGARRPILALAEEHGDVGWVLKESGARFRIVPYSQPRAIQDALVSLLRDEPTPDVFPVEDVAASAFTREATAARLAQALDVFASGDKRMRGNGREDARSAGR